MERIVMWLLKGVVRVVVVMGRRGGGGESGMRGKSLRGRTRADIIKGNEGAYYS